MDHTVDVRNPDTGETLATNIPQAAAWDYMSPERYAAGYRIVPHGRTMVADNTAVGGQDIERQTVERINAQVMEVRKYDRAFTPVATVVPFGTRLVDDKRQREVRRDHSDRPLAVDGIDQMIATLRAEEREDFDVTIGDINIADDGRFYLGDDAATPFRFTPTAWKSLLANLGEWQDGDAHGDTRGWLAGMLHAPVAETVRAWRTAKSLIATNKAVRAGVRFRNGELEGYRFVSPGYSDDTVQADALLAEVRDAIVQSGGAGEYRIASRYNPEDTGVRIDVTRNMPDLDGFGAGDPFRYGFRIQTGDGGNRGISYTGTAERNRCVNLYIVATELFGKRSVRHRKGQEGIALVGLREVFAMQHAIMDTFNPIMQKARGMSVAAALGAGHTLRTEDGARKVMEQVANLRAMRRVTSAISRDTVVEALILGAAFEPDEDNVAAIANAVTRAHSVELIGANHVPLFEAAAVPLMQQLVS